MCRSIDYDDYSNWKPKKSYDVQSHAGSSSTTATAGSSSRATVTAFVTM